MKLSLFGAAMGVALVAASASAQSVMPAVKPVNFGVAGGMTVPTGDFGNAAKAGYNVSGLLEYRGPMWPVALRVEGQYQHFSSDLGDGATYKTLGGLANVLYYVPSKGLVKPYVTGGLGFFHLTSDEGSSCTTNCSGSENKVGFDFGAGLQFQLTGMSTFIEGNWQSVQTDGSAVKMFPIRVGIKF